MDKVEGLKVESRGGLGCDSAGQPVCAEEQARSLAGGAEESPQKTWRDSHSDQAAHTGA
jgi:hypothetical protein